MRKNDYFADRIISGYRNFVFEDRLRFFEGGRFSIENFLMETNPDVYRQLETGRGEASFAEHVYSLTTAKKRQVLDSIVSGEDLKEEMAKDLRTATQKICAEERSRMNRRNGN